MIIIILCIIISISILILAIIVLFKKTNDKFILQSQDIELSPKLSKKDIVNLKEGQKKMTNMLKEFNRICRKHNIRYFVVGGTCLGALLYNGWIPWDSDIDLEIFSEDYPKFKSIIQKELPKNMWFQNNETDKYYPKNQNVIGKIRDLNSCYIEWTNNTSQDWHNGLQIDINSCTLDKKNNKVYFSDSENNNFITPKEMLPLKEILFEGIPIFIMNNSEKYLSRKYGKNWFKVLPLKKRFSHEGKIDGFKTCPFHYEKYSHLHKKN